MNKPCLLPFYALTAYYLLSLQPSHLLTTQITTVARFQYFIHRLHHLFFILLQRSLNGQIIGSMTAYKSQIINGNILKKDFHFFEGFKGIQYFEFSLLHLSVKYRTRDGCNG